MYCYHDSKVKITTFTDFVYVRLVNEQPTEHGPESSYGHIRHCFKLRSVVKLYGDAPNKKELSKQFDVDDKLFKINNIRNDQWHIQIMAKLKEHGYHGFKFGTEICIQAECLELIDCIIVPFIDMGDY